MSNDRILTELERQEKYLSKLPPNFDYPVFNVRYAVESQRKSGYRNTAAASREIVDNAIEAGADWVHVIFDIGRSEREGKGVKKLVNAVAFIDNGSGMIPQMARFALSWGGGTHFDDPSFIGKFGFGLPNASINQTRRAEVYTRTSIGEKFMKAWLDLDEFTQYGLQQINEPQEAKLPQFVQDYLERESLRLDHGTVVVWTQPDRLTYKTPAPLKEHLLDDFGVTYRYLLANPENPLELVVEGKIVDPVDPLFLMPEGKYHLLEKEGGAQLAEERFLAVKYTRDPGSGEYHLTSVQDPVELSEDDPNLISAGAVHVRIARLPVGFAAEGKARGIDTDAQRRFEIRQSRRGMSFVRAGREIQTFDAFPRSARDRANGLGNWPLLQSYAYHWGVEVTFDPELDDVFGITNDKQGVRPIEDFWRVLHEAGIDDSLRRENDWQRQQRKKAPKLVPSDTPSPAEQAAQEADMVGATKPQIPEHRLPEVRDNFEKKIQNRAKSTGQSIEDMREAAEKEAKRRQYKIDYYNSEDGPFYKPEWDNSQIVVWINRLHPFYQVVYGDLLRLLGGERALQAINVLLIALAKAELTADEQIQVWYEAQRKLRWSPYLEVALKSLSQLLPLAEEETVEAVDSEELTPVGIA